MVRFHQAVSWVFGTSIACYIDIDSLSIKPFSSSLTTSLTTLMKTSSTDNPSSQRHHISTHASTNHPSRSNVVWGSTRPWLRFSKAIRRPQPSPSPRSRSHSSHRPSSCDICQWRKLAYGAPLRQLVVNGTDSFPRNQLRMGRDLYEPAIHDAAFSCNLCDRF